MDTGTKVYRNYFPIKFGWQNDCKYGVAYPVFRKLMYPGDVFKVHADLLIRYQPMLTPPMNDCVATVRFGFVPLRLIESNTELIVTGSDDGHLSEETLPVMDSVFHDLNVTGDESRYYTKKHSLLDEIYHIPNGLDLHAAGLLEKLDADKASPAAYFAKAFYRFWWDYYRDENLFTSYTDFESLWNAAKGYLHINTLPSVALKKDRLTSALPWQLKAAVIPRIEVGTIGSFTPQFDTAFITGNGAAGYPITMVGESDQIFNATFTSSNPHPVIEALNAKINAELNKEQSGSLNIDGIGFTMAQLRELSAQTRVFERLARCGSRYTEYLRANFGVSPADETLQRSQYLGGFKTRIVTTEVIQTAAAGDNPVGTLRGHGITHGTAQIKTFMAKEIGVMIAIMDVKPETIYAQGVDRELTCRSRFDFLNPSFQHLSEQEVRKGEIYFGVDTDSDGNLVNSQTWGFQPYAQELRTGIKHVCGDMRDSLSYWNQALIFSSRPSLNNSFISAENHTASYNRPFAVSSAGAYPMIVDFGGYIEAYRPLVKNGTPGLTDHN